MGKRKPRPKPTEPIARYNRHGLRLCSFCDRMLPMNAEEEDLRLCAQHQREWNERHAAQTTIPNEPQQAQASQTTDDGSEDSEDDGGVAVAAGVDQDVLVELAGALREAEVAVGQWLEELRAMQMTLDQCHRLLEGLTSKP